MTSKQIADEIINQIRVQDKTLLMALGAKDFTYFLDKDKNTTLQFKVNGVLHKGLVWITLNEGRDEYDVKLLKLRSGVLKTVYEQDGLYAEDLPEFLISKAY